MIEKQYKNLLIATIKMGEYEEKEHIVSSWRLITVSFQKDFAFTHHLLDHRKAYVYS